MKAIHSNSVSRESNWRWRIFVIIFSFLALHLSAQFPVNYQYTLLADSLAGHILGASSGEMAMKHITSLAPYTRARSSEELSDTLHESRYIMEMLKEYGLKNYSLDIVGKTTAWHGIEGSVWEVNPGMSKLADFRDVPEMLVEGSQPADTSAQLLWVGEGERSFFERNAAMVKGKIVVTSSSPGAVHMQALSAGAVGTISFYSPRPYADPIQIPNASISRRGFAFMLPPREGILLRNRLLSGEKIRVKVVVRSASDPVTLQVPQCVVEGKDPKAPEIIFTAHLFEGYVKMGANDNMSGAAVILEVARLLNTLINEGKLEKPERNIRFLWVPEFSGTIPWVNRNLQLVRSAMCNINLDMVGLHLRDNRSFMHLHRSGYSTAHFANDVMESYFRYVGESNVEGITDNLGRRGFSNRIVAPSGSDDPFYYRISTLHGNSDNAVFNDWSINLPGLKLITWPDTYYHTSEDNPDKCDPTQLRRVIFICAAGAYTLASADEAMAQRIAGEMYAGAVARTGYHMARSADMIWQADKQNLPAIYRRAANNIEGVVLTEKAALEKLIQISSNQNIVSIINSGRTRLDNLLQIHQGALRETMAAKCRAEGLQEIQLRQDESERNAVRIIPVRTSAADKMGYGGEAGFISKIPSEFARNHPARGVVNTDEAAGLADGKRNLLQIKKMIDAQFETETPLQDLINYFALLKEAGLMQY
jgi:hypothetical protein